MHTRLLVMLTLGLVPITGLAQMYSWKDASGKIHYGDRPPAGKEDVARTLRAPAPPEDAETRRKAFLERQMAERERLQKAQEEKRQADNKPVPVSPPVPPPVNVTPGDQ
jgi:hypothetical protein